MTDDQLAAMLLALAWLGGYGTARARLGGRLVDWADDQLTERPAWVPRFWAAAPVALVATALLWLAHPRRSRASYRAHQAAKRRHLEPVPVPQYDPEWTTRRGGPQT
ncbi:hypothetical protein ACFU6S_06340 [Streptomyces sp. NPDC057456]|uniref:hypothetical protein n=1 Tax=Streptomyces sp. NPDC057456 TaxID=3346139 RepID=UPI0036C5F4D6